MLDQLPNWPEDEYMILGGETRWKLEKRRGYFLDRVLKMGLVEVEKDYICVRPPSRSRIVARRPPTLPRLTLCSTSRPLPPLSLSRPPVRTCFTARIVSAPVPVCPSARRKVPGSIRRELPLRRPSTCVSSQLP